MDSYILMRISPAQRDGSRTRHHLAHMDALDEALAWQRKLQGRADGDEFYLIETCTNESGNYRYRLLDVPVQVDERSIWRSSRKRCPCCLVWHDPQPRPAQG